MKRTLIRNEALVHFVSLRSSLDFQDGQLLSRVEMNAPSGALDSPLRDRWEIFLSLALDMADDFIDGCLD